MTGHKEDNTHDKEKKTYKKKSTQLIKSSNQIRQEDILRDIKIYPQELHMNKQKTTITEKSILSKNPKYKPHTTQNIPERCRGCG